MAAILGSAAAKQYLMWLYVTQDNLIAQVKQNSAYASFYDDQRQGWSIQFSTDDDATKFVSVVERLVKSVSLQIEDVEEGTGDAVAVGDKLGLRYTGYLEQNGKPGTVFDSNAGADKKLLVITLGKGEVIKGWDRGLVGMKLNGRRVLSVPPSLAYGAAGFPPSVPPHATLIFDITLERVRLSEEHKQQLAKHTPQSLPMPEPPVPALPSLTAPADTEDDQHTRALRKAKMFGTPMFPTDVMPHAVAEQQQHAQQQQQQQQQAEQQPQQVFAAVQQQTAGQQGQAPVPAAMPPAAPFSQDPHQMPQQQQQLVPQQQQQLQQGFIQPVHMQAPAPQLAPQQQQLQQLSPAVPQQQQMSYAPAQTAFGQQQPAGYPTQTFAPAPHQQQQQQQPTYASHSPYSSASGSFTQTTPPTAAFAPQQQFPPQQQAAPYTGQFPYGQGHYPPYTQPSAPVPTDPVALLVEQRQTTTHVARRVDEIADKLDNMSKRLDSDSFSTISRRSRADTSIGVEDSLGGQTLIVNIQRMVDDYERVKAELATKSERVDTLQAKVTELLEKNERVIEEKNRQIQERTETLEQSADKVRSKLLELQTQKGSLELQLAQALEQTGDAQRTLSEVKRERDDLQAQLTTTRSDLENAQRELTSSRMLLSAEQVKSLEMQNTLKDERAARKAASDALDAVREELAEEREAKSKVTQQLEERKKKQATDTKRLEVQFEDEKARLEEEMNKLREQLRKTRLESGQTTQAQIAELEKVHSETVDALRSQHEAHVAKLKADAENDKTEALKRGLREGFERGRTQGAQETQEAYDVTLAQKEAEYAEQLQHLQAELDEAAQEKDAIIAKSKEVVQRVRDSTREQVEEEASEHLALTVKKAMSAVYATMTQRLDDAHRYYGSKITQALLAVIKHKTLKVMNGEEEEEEEEEVEPLSDDDAEWQPSAQPPASIAPAPVAAETVSLAVTAVDEQQTAAVPQTTQAIDEDWDEIPSQPSPATTVSPATDNMPDEQPTEQPHEQQQEEPQDNAQDVSGDDQQQQEQEAEQQAVEEPVPSVEAVATQQSTAQLVFDPLHQQESDDERPPTPPPAADLPPPPAEPSDPAPPPAAVVSPTRSSLFDDDPLGGSDELFMSDPLERKPSKPAVKPVSIKAVPAAPSPKLGSADDEDAELFGMLSSKKSPAPAQPSALFGDEEDSSLFK